MKDTLKEETFEVRNFRESEYIIDGFTCAGRISYCKQTHSWALYI